MQCKNVKTNFVDFRVNLVVQTAHVSLTGLSYHRQINFVFKSNTTSVKMIVLLFQKKISGRRNNRKTNIFFRL